jgi:uncharacterized membrane protein YeaQ/YmgE (transglycosylase-associated protein family)
MGILGWVLVGLIAGAGITEAPQRGASRRWCRHRGCAHRRRGLALATGDDSSLNEFDLGSIGIAILGSVVLVLVLEAPRRSPRGRAHRRARPRPDNPFPVP